MHGTWPNNMPLKLEAAALQVPTSHWSQHGFQYVLYAIQIGWPWAPWPVLACGLRMCPLANKTHAFERGCHAYAYCRAWAVCIRMTMS